MRGGVRTLRHCLFAGRRKSDGALHHAGPGLREDMRNRFGIHGQRLGVCRGRLPGLRGNLPRVRRGMPQTPGRALPAVCGRLRALRGTMRKDGGRITSVEQAVAGAS